MLGAGKYVLQQGNFRGQNAIEVTAVTRRTPERKVSCKFFATAADFHHESQLSEILPANGAALGATLAYDTSMSCTHTDGRRTS